MLKYLIILINFVGILGYKVLFPGGVSISSDLPASINPGEDVIVTVNINKGELGGFAKFTQDFPKGFTVTLIDGADATFSFKDQSMKFIWVSLPSASEFSFSYKLSVDASLSGSYEMSGIFSYIFDNEKQNAFLEKRSIQVGPSTAASTPTDQGGVKGMVKEEVEGVKVRRTTSPIQGLSNTFKVELRIDKPDISGFAKIEESIPEGFSASEMDSRGGIFSFENQLLKVIWMSVPDNEQFYISYQLKAGDNVSGNQKITGAFSYLDGDESSKYYVSPSTIFIEKDDGDEVPLIIISDDGGDFKEKETPVVAATPPPPVVEKTPEPKEVKIPEPQYNVSYRVQVAAGHNPVTNDYFSKKFSLNEDIIIDNHQGWIKYTFGSFDVYKDSRDERNKVWSDNKITDAFVTAYNAGNRITVQEALMISNQKWYN